MRNIISFTVASLVVASLALLPEGGVRAQAIPGGDDGRGGGVADEPVGVVVLDGIGGGRDGNRDGARAVPAVVQIDTMPEPGSDPGEKYTVAITFNQVITGLELGELVFVNANTVSELTSAVVNSATVFSVDVRPTPGLEGTMTVTVKAGAVSNDEGSNAAFSESFVIDNKAPVLDRATVDETRLALYYHEEFDESVQGAADQFPVTISPADGSTDLTPTFIGIDVEDDSIVLTLATDDAVGAGDEVKLAYTGSAIRDERGNLLATFTDQPVENLNSGENRYPSAVRDLEATPVDGASIKLEWKPPLSAGAGSNVTITGYRIEESPNGNSDWTILVGNTTDPNTTYTHGNLTENTTRYYRVAAINSANLVGPSSNTAHATTGEVPGAPTGLRANADGPYAIDLSWTAPAAAGSSAISGYRIEVSPNGTSGWEDAEDNTGSTNTSYKHRGLQPGSTHHYRVSAINNSGPGAPSGSASATTDIVTTVPDPPTNLVATAQGQNQIDLSWTAPANDGGSAITGYRIERSHDGNNWTALSPISLGVQTTYSETGLAPATTRHYRVYARNGVGLSATASAPAFTTTAAAPPGPPTRLRATAQGTSQINLSWIPPADDGGSPITGYLVEYSLDGQTWPATWRFDVDDDDATSFSHTGLTAGSTRHYRVSAINTAAGKGPPSAPASATTHDVPEVPRDLSATPRANDHTRIDLAWRAPASDGGSPITKYLIEFSANGANWQELAEVGASVTRYVHEGLTAASTWHYRVRAHNVIGPGPFTAPTHTTTGATRPDPPPDLEATAVGRTRIDLDWETPDFNGGSSILDYRIEVSPDAGESWSTIQREKSTRTRHAHTGLSSGTTRHYRVYAVNAVGESEPSEVKSATTAPNVPGPPRGLRAEATGMTTIDLSWTPPASDSGAAITEYRIETSPTGNSGWESAGTTTETDFTHTDLTPDTRYYYRVRAVNSVGAGAPSNRDDATTDPTVPDAPTNLTATADGPTRIRLTWSPPRYNGGSLITGYRIDVSTDEGTTWGLLRVVNPSTIPPSYVDSGLRPGTTRHYRVSAINAVGTGEASDVRHATTPAVVPGAPTQLSATADGPFQIDLSWTAPTYDGGAELTGYRIEVSENRGVTWRILERNTGSLSTAYSHEDLPAATRRDYRVSAVNAVGASAPSNAVHATTEPDVPGAPTGLEATADGPYAIDLSWHAPGYSGGVDIAGYRIEWSEDGESPWQVLEANTRSTSTEYSNTGLDPATTRHYRVSTINAADLVSEPSDEADATTDAVVPDAPTDLDATENGPFRIDLSWTAPKYDGGSDLTGYRIEVSENRGVTWRVLERNTRSLSTAYSHEDLPAATRRDYRVSAVNAVGASLPSNEVHATTEPDVPDAPTGLEATADGPYEIDLSWTAPDYTGGVDITGYRIEWSADGRSPWEVLEADTRSSDTEYSDAGLDPATTRHYRVSAINEADLVSDPSNEADATTDAIAPDAPTDLTATADGTSRIDLEWTAPEYDGGAAITGYRIEVSEDAGDTWSDLVEDTESIDTDYAHTGLAPASTRRYRVSAINRVGPGDPSDEAEATTDATVPDAPQSLTATAHDHERIDLDWEAPAFDGGAAISGYRIEISDNAGSTWSVLVANTSSDATDYAHTGLNPATTRHYRVSAINEIGLSERSNVASATTDAIAPDRPTNLVATATESTRIDLEWEAPGYDGGAPISGYRIEVSEDGAAWTDLQRSTGSPRTSYAHVGLRPGSTRHYRVSAINVAGTGLPSNVATATTDDPKDRAGRVNAAILPHFAAAATSSSMAAISGRIEAVASRNPLRSQLSAAGLLSRAGNMGRGSGRDLNMARLFDGQSFALPLGGGGRQEDIATPFGFTTWGSAEYTSMGEPAGDEVTWEGDMLSIHIGADARIHRDFLAGIAGSRSTGNYDFTDKTGAREVAGTYEARMNSLNPYLAWLPGRTGVSVWAAGSFGWGEVTVTDDPAGARAGNTSSRGGAVGGSRIVHSTGESALRVRAEGWMSEVQVEGSEGMDSLTLDMQRLRVALEWMQVRRLSGGQEINFMVEGGLRYGDGDGTEGAGMEIGGGLRFESATKALTVEGHGRLLATGPEEYDEWGFRGMIQIEPQAVARGLSVKINPAWGQSASGVQELYERGAAGRTGMGDALQQGRVNTRVEYGLGEFGGTPYGRFYLADGGARAFGTGMRYSVTRVLDLRFEGTRTERAGAPARHGLAMRGRWVF